MQVHKGGGGIAMPECLNRQVKKKFNVHGLFLSDERYLRVLMITISKTIFILSYMCILLRLSHMTG